MCSRGNTRNTGTLQVHYKYTTSTLQSTLQVHYKYTTSHIQVHYKYSTSTLQVHYKYTRNTNLLNLTGLFLSWRIQNISSSSFLCLLYAV